VLDRLERLTELLHVGAPLGRLDLAAVDLAEKPAPGACFASRQGGAVLGRQAAEIRQSRATLPRRAPGLEAEHGQAMERLGRLGIVRMLLHDGLVARHRVARPPGRRIAVGGGERRLRRSGFYAGTPRHRDGREHDRPPGADAHPAISVPGRCTVKRLPWPGSDSTATCPPCASTMLLTIASPRPVPAAA